MKKVTSKVTPAIATSKNRLYLLKWKTKKMIAKTTDRTIKAIVSKTTEMTWAVKVKEPVLKEADHKLMLTFKASKLSLKYATIKKQIRNNTENNKILL